jgi:HrpA-like RNA helicase
VLSLFFRTYVHERRFSILEVRPISQAQAIQRAGRAGRCEDGKCYRLYSKASYEQLEKQATPEILRTSLSDVLFNLFSANITNPKRCKFLDNPTDDEWCAALDELMALELIQASNDTTVHETRDYFALEVHEKMRYF